MLLVKATILTMFGNLYDELDDIGYSNDVNAENGEVCRRELFMRWIVAEAQKPKTFQIAAFLRAKFFRTKRADTLLSTCKKHA